MFINTLGVKACMVQDWVKVKHGIHKSPSTTKQPTKKKIDDVDQRQSVTDFLQNLSKMPSHYCRASTEKQYLESIIPSKSELYRVYTQWCLDNQKTQASRWLLMNVFSEMNIAFFQPKKDQCDVCCSYETQNISEEEYQAHVHKKEQAQAEKSKDKENVVENATVVAMDVQAVLTVPRILASAVYYRTKLSCHNFTVFNVHTKDTICYFWHEAQGRLTANSFASCIYDYLENEIKDDVDTVILYSDGCPYQNRNVTLANALCHFAKKTILQKYLFKGHTQMEVDSVHSAIERKLKKKQIYSPAGFVTVIEEARLANSYKVKYVDHKFFSDFSTKNYRSSIRPGSRAGDPHVTDLVALKYLPDGNIEYKLDFEKDWANLEQRVQRNIERESDAPSLYTKRLPISAQKYQHLQQLKSVIPQDYHNFFDNLPHL